MVGQRLLLYYRYLAFLVDIASTLANTYNPIQDDSHQTGVHKLANTSLEKLVTEKLVASFGLLTLRISIAQVIA